MKQHLLHLILLLLVLACADVLASMPKRKLAQEITPRKRCDDDSNTPPLTLNKNQIVFGKRLGKKTDTRPRDSENKCKREKHKEMYQAVDFS